MAYKRNKGGIAGKLCRVRVERWGCRGEGGESGEERVERRGWRGEGGEERVKVERVER